MEQHEPERRAPQSPSADAVHPADDALALIAIGESAAAPHEAQHLAECSACQDEVRQLREAAQIARTTLGESALLEPSAAVWAGIHRELGLAADVRPPAPTPISSHPDAAALDQVPAAAAAVDAPAPVVSMADARVRRSTLRRVAAPVLAVAAVAAAATTVALSWDALRPSPAPVTVAAAELQALPAWDGASGDAVVTESASGERIVSIDLASVSAGEGVREVWLLTPEVDGLISLGLLEGDSGEFVIPDGIDLAEYPIVDISLEPVDGDPAHSGDSIVRGALDV